MSRTLTVALLAAGCLTAAAGGSYLAVRQNAVTPVAAAAPAAEPAPSTPATPVMESEPPVHESEGIIEMPNGEPPRAPELERAPRPTPTRPAPESRRRTVPTPIRQRPQPSVRAASGPAPSADLPAGPAEGPPANATTEPLPVLGRSAAQVETPTYAPSEPVGMEVVIPASTVIGLEIETTVSSERAQVEDRVAARVTRDVFADGRLALPAGSRVIGAVSLVERGGKVKERARLGIRFHTVALASGRQVSLRTEPIYREGESPAGESSRKIGGAAIGGAMLGALLGGGKGAIAGATAGAAGGTAAVMTGDRNSAVLSSGSIVTVKLADPASFDVER